MSFSQLRTHYLACEIKYSGYITEFACNHYIRFDRLCVKITTKDTKYSECSKNNKKYIDVFWDFLDYIRDNIYRKLNAVLDNLKAI